MPHLTTLFLVLFLTALGAKVCLIHHRIESGRDFLFSIPIFVPGFCLAASRVRQFIKRKAKLSHDVALAAIAYAVTGIFASLHPKSFLSLMIWATCGGTMLSQELSALLILASTSREKIGKHLASKSRKLSIHRFSTR